MVGEAEPNGPLGIPEVPADQVGVASCQRLFIGGEGRRHLGGHVRPVDLHAVRPFDPFGQELPGPVENRDTPDRAGRLTRSGPTSAAPPLTDR